MNREESMYGFIANTKATQITSSETIALQNYTNNTNTSNEIVGASIARPQITFPANVNRIILKIVDTTKYEPIKAKAYYDENVEKIKIEVTYSTNNISKIIDSKGKVLSTNSKTADTGDEVIGNKVYTYTIIDNLGNQKQVSVSVSGLDVYIIENETDLKFFRDAVNAGKTTAKTKAYQIADVTMNEGKFTTNLETGTITTTGSVQQWTPIGNSSKPYNGKYYGNNHTISGIYINNSAEYQGLFGRCGTAEIKDLGIVNSYIKGKEYVGGIVGYGYASSSSDCRLTNCYSKSSIIGERYAGGIVGYGQYITIQDCYNAGIVSSTVNGYIGGICGNLYTGNIIKSYNEGIVKSTTYFVGGIVGQCNMNSADRYISECYNNGIVQGTNYIGGIVGSYGATKGNITKSYNLGSVSGNESVGGIAGRNSCWIEQCYNTGNVNGTKFTGGISGNFWNENIGIRYAYNIGDVTGDSDVGGITGRQNYGYTNYSYNAGAVISINDSSAAVGGIVGHAGGSNNATNNTYINNCYNLSSSIKTNGSGSWTYCGGIVGDTGLYVYLNSCYNSGDMTGSIAKYKGGIAGSIYYYNNGYFYPTNCGFLRGSAPIAIGRPAYNPTNERYKISTLSAEEMPDILTVIGSTYFTEDTENINNGYPIFKWQVETE